MEKKKMTFKPKGMNKDLSVSAFNPEFAFDIRNMRLSTNESNTMLSWVNEKGTAPINLLNIDLDNEETINSLSGTPIGTAIVNHKLVIFTHNESAATKPDHIYVLRYRDNVGDNKNVLLVHQLYNGNLNFSVNYPLETLASYEAEHIQKVYWVDGLNQPRIINIAAKEETVNKWNATQDNSIDHYFDFVPEIKSFGNITVSQKAASGGIFAPGVIQYCLTYINRYGQQTNIFYTSQLFYLSHKDSGASPEDKVSSTFEITMTNVDDNFDYVRIYSVQRTSIDSVPIVKFLEDIPITGNPEVTYNEDTQSEGILPITKEDVRFKDVTYNPSNYDYSISIPTYDNIPGVSYSTIVGKFYPNVFVRYQIDAGFTWNPELANLEDDANTYDLIGNQYIDDLILFLKWEKYHDTGDPEDEPDEPYEGDLVRLSGSNSPIVIYEELYSLLEEYEKLFIETHVHVSAVYEPDRTGAYVTIPDLYDAGGLDGNEYTVTAHYAELPITGPFLEYLDDFAERMKEVLGKDVDGWVFDFYVGENSSTISISRNTLINKKLIYSYKDYKWYVTVDSPIVEVDDAIKFTDNGNIGSTIDAYELLYVGGKDIVVSTMAEKDQTLFVGNLEQKNTLVDSIQNLFNRKRASEYPVDISFRYNKYLPISDKGNFYNYKNTLAGKGVKDITTFKGGETYRFGFQLQKKTGEWLEPIFIGDYTNNLYPKTSLSADTQLVSAFGELNIAEIASTYAPDYEQNFYDIFAKIRPVIVYPNIEDRSVLCQGVINPTVFNILDRIDNSPYAQPSWFFRPYTMQRKTSGSNIDLNITVTKDSDDGYVEGANNPYFEKGENLCGVYVAIVQFNYITTSKIDNSEKHIKEFLERGYLEYTVSVSKRGYKNTKLSQNVEQAYFDLGAVYINRQIVASETICTYALLSSSSWPEEGITENLSDGTSTAITYITKVIIDLRYKISIKNIHNIQSQFDIYNKLQKTSKNFCYYVVPEGEDLSVNPPITTYYFKFTDENNNKYQIAFNDAGISGELFANPNKGDIISFAHFDSLCSQDTVAENDTIYRTAKQVEIQGSYSIFSNPLLTYEDRDKGTSPTKCAFVDAPSNTQFFIDQSIVTLNSPDIEFNTYVQSYGLDNLKLRIVGIIPITGSASYHHITAGSNMLEEGFGTRYGPDENGNYVKDGIKVAKFGQGETHYNNYHKNLDIYAGRHLVAEYLWQDVIVYPNRAAKKGGDEDVFTGRSNHEHLVYPWHRQGSLNNDHRDASEASSLLKTKKLSNLLYSMNTEYLNSDIIVNFLNVSTGLHLTENEEILNIKLDKQKRSDEYRDINYYSNIDKVLYNTEGYQPVILKADNKRNDTSGTWRRLGGKHVYEAVIDNLTRGIESLGSKPLTLYNPVSMKYKSTSHAIIALKAPDSSRPIPIMPSVKISSETNVGAFNQGNNKYPYWNTDIEMLFNQSTIDISNLNYYSRGYDFLLLGELYKYVDPTTRFGGTTKAALLQNKWYPCGSAKDISSSNNKVTLKWEYGDTYYQRYDCLKTYAFTPDDPNQIIEILSFMCETNVNIDGRYDRNRGQLDNTDMHPKNFNIINSAYSQQDTYFEYRKMDTEDLDKLNYPNTVYYTKTKTAGADVDLYTNINMASTLDLDGDKGVINALENWNNTLLVFQDTGMAKILYNESTAVSSAEGTPIEIANSGKVQGTKYLSGTIGCSNKWSIANTESGLYFMSSNDRSIQQFTGELKNLSIQAGFSAWCKQNISKKLNNTSLWNPKDFGDFKAVYDAQNLDILWINKDYALAWSAKFGAFTSFYDYGDTPYLCNFEDTGVWIRKDGTLWKHQGDSNMCRFFNNDKGAPVYYPFSMTFIANQEPTLDKIFTNLELRASVANEGGNLTPYAPYIPFDTIETWNEYQHGIGTFSTSNYIPHHKSNGLTELDRKFRIWRSDIPRDNVRPDDTTENPRGIFRKIDHPLDRMRNPWIYFKLEKTGLALDFKTEVHDVQVVYF